MLPMFIVIIAYSRDFTTKWLLTTEHMAIFAVKFIVVQINGHFDGSINLLYILLYNYNNSTLHNVQFNFTINNCINPARCVKEPVCNAEWWFKTSTSTDCLSAMMDDSPSGPANMAMTCNFCCVTSLCNDHVKPTDPGNYYIGDKLPPMTTAAP